MRSDARDHRTHGCVSVCVCGTFFRRMRAACVPTPPWVRVEDGAERLRLYDAWERARAQVEAYYIAEMYCADPLNDEAFGREVNARMATISAIMLAGVIGACTLQNAIRVI